MSDDIRFERAGAINLDGYGGERNPETDVLAAAFAQPDDGRRGGMAVARERWREPLPNSLDSKMTPEERARPLGLRPLPSQLRFRKAR